MVCEQLDLFETSINNEQEETQEDSKLTTRQHRLRDWLEDNFISGKYFSIEEIVAGVKDKEGRPFYTLNKDPYKHDKCIALSNDVRAINWCDTDRYKIIIKDSKGGCKLVESEEEFEIWRKKELAKIEPKYQYLNNLKWKAAREDTCPVVNLNNRALTPDEVKPVDVFMR